MGSGHEMEISDCFMCYNLDIVFFSACLNHVDGK